MHCRTPPLHIHRHPPSWVVLCAADLFCRADCRGATISIATFARLPINALVTWQGDWLVVPILVLAAGFAAYMLASPLELHAVMLGVGAGHAMDTSQTEHSLIFRWCLAQGLGEEDGRRKRRLRWQAFSATAGYSTGALFGGSVYELGGFGACAWLQVSLCCSLAVLMCGLPVVHAAFRARRQPVVAGTAVASASGAGGDDEQQEEKTLANTTGRFWLPVSLVLLCDGLNVSAGTFPVALCCTTAPCWLC